MELRANGRLKHRIIICHLSISRSSNSSGSSNSCISSSILIPMQNRIIF